MKRIILAAIGAAAAAGLTACGHAAAPAGGPGAALQAMEAQASGCRSAAASSTAPGRTGTGRDLSPPWMPSARQPAAGDPHVLKAALKKARPAVASAARHPMPGCADPRGYWYVLLMHVNAAAAKGSSASSIRAAMQGVPQIAAPADHRTEADHPINRPGGTDMSVTGLVPHRALARRSIISLGLAVLLGLALLVNVRPAVAAGPCGPPVVSVIACENTLPGDPPSDWQVSGAGDSTIQGFATSMSVNVGQTESFKIDTPPTSYHIDILRLGWYGGDGARKVVSDMLPTATLPQTQPACINDTAAHRAHRLRQLGRVGLVDGAVQRRVRLVPRPSGPR